MDDIGGCVPTVVSHSAALPSALLQDLPQLIVEDIVQHIRQMTQWDGYLCDLRLTNRQFNEAVLHCLAFRGRPRNFLPGHYMSCTHICRRYSCQTFGISNQFYSRLFLQGKIATSRDEDVDRKRYYSILRQSLAFLRTALAPTDNSCLITTSYLRDSPSLHCGSANPIFSDKLSILLCDAVVEYSRMRSSRGAYASWLDHNIYSESSPHFWLRILACYVGDLELFRHCVGDTRSAEGSSTPLSKEQEQLLGMTARRGHEAMFELLSVEFVSQNVDLAYALCGASYSGSSLILGRVFQVTSDASLPNLCRKSLLCMHESYRLPPAYSHVAEEIVSNLHPHLNGRFHIKHLMWIQAALGATDRVRQLIERYREQACWPLRDLHECSASALWSACLNGSLECVNVLLQGGCISARARKDGMTVVCEQCAQIAMRSNSPLIYEELYRYMGIPMHAAPIEELAGMDCTMHHISERLEIEPNVMETPVSDQCQRQIGQLALVCAATLLQVENVRFLLQRGVRLDEEFLQTYESKIPGSSTFRIEWRYRRAHEVQYQQVQSLLQSYGVRTLCVQL